MRASAARRARSPCRRCRAAVRRRGLEILVERALDAASPISLLPLSRTFFFTPRASPVPRRTRRLSSAPAARRATCVARSAAARRRCGQSREIALDCPRCRFVDSARFTCSRNAGGVRQARPYTSAGACARCARRRPRRRTRNDRRDARGSHARASATAGGGSRAPGGEVMRDLAKDPRAALRRAADHQSVGARVAEHRRAPAPALRCRRSRSRECAPRASPRAMVSYSTRPANRQARVRPWTASAATPASSRDARDRASALRAAGAGPVRILSVTGTVDGAHDGARVCARPAIRSPSSAEPAAALHTFFAGQPMLMSMICAPRSTL